MVPDRASRVTSALTALSVPTGGSVSLDVEGRGIASGCPETYIQIFRFLIRRFWDVIGGDFMTVGALVSARQGAVGHLTAGGGSASAVIDLVLGFPNKEKSHGLAYRRIVRFNREVLGMNKMYLLEAQFVKPNGFRERKMDMVLDMVKVLKDKEAARGRLQGQSASKEVKADLAHIAPRASLPEHVAARFAQPVEWARRAPGAGPNDYLSEQDPIRLNNPLFSLSETGSSLASSNLDNNPEDRDDTPAMDVTRVGFHALPEIHMTDFCGQFSDVSVDAEALRLSDHDHDDALHGRDTRGVAHVVDAPFGSLIDALRERISSIRQLLPDECLTV